MNENKNSTGIVPTLAITCEDFDKITNKLLEQENEIVRLHNIIKEVREYIENTYEDYKNEDGSLPLTLHDQELLEILDKENK